MTPSTELTLFTIATLFGTIFSLACLPWRINSMYIDTVLLASWLLVGCFVLFVNSLAMNAVIWCDISTKLMIGAYIGVPASMVCVLQRLYSTLSSPHSLPDKRFYQLLWRLALMLGTPALIIIVHIIVQDRRYIFIEQAGCIPSISPSLFPLVVVLIWPLLFDLASLAYLGLIIHLIWVSRRTRGGTPASPETVSLPHLLRLPISMFLGIVSTGSFSLFLLLLLVNIPGISVNSLHHDFQTISVIPTLQWSIVPPLRAAVELRWLWASLGPGLTVGLFPKERVDRVLRWLAAPRTYIRMRKWHQEVSNAAPHGSLPVYISRTSSSSYGETFAIPPLILQPTAANSRGSFVLHQPSGVTPHIPEPKISRSWESIRPDEPVESQETSQPVPPLPSRSLQRGEPRLNPVVSIPVLADSIWLADSIYRSHEEETARR